jgi:hypothetical protein
MPGHRLLTVVPSSGSLCIAGEKIGRFWGSLIEAIACRLAGSLKQALAQLGSMCTLSFSTSAFELYPIVGETCVGPPCFTLVLLPAYKASPPWLVLSVRPLSDSCLTCGQYSRILRKGARRRLCLKITCMYGTLVCSDQKKPPGKVVYLA